MSSMPLNLEHHHHFTGSKHALAMASTLQPLQRAGDTKHRLDVHAVSDTSSPESVGKLRAPPVQTQRLHAPFAAAGSARANWRFQLSGSRQISRQTGESEPP